MRIAFLGSRGIPRCYSGFETFVEEVAVRLVRRGHEVTVYNRVPFNPYREREFQGVRIVSLPTLPTKGTDTLVHTMLSVGHSLFQNYDVVYFCGVGNALWAFVPRAQRRLAVVNVDGADFARAKWGRIGRWWLKQSEGWAARLAHVVIADHPAIQTRYHDAYGVEAELIPYGAEVVEEDPGTEALTRWGLERGRYFLYVSRLTPENGADLVMEAYLQAGLDIPLVVVGDAPYQDEFIRGLKRRAEGHPGILMTGYQFGQAYRQLSFHARAFLYPTAIDATRPVVLDQMGFGNPVIARDTPANRHVVGEAAWYFSPEDAVRSLARVLTEVRGDDEGVRHKGQRARERVRTRYNWDSITDRYVALFERRVGSAPVLRG
jgi:glycosyltransferase involved in cell wall biosynthesis